MLSEMKRDHFRCLKSPSQRLKVTEAIFILGLDSDLNVFAHSHTTRIGMFYRLRLLHINDTLTQLDRAMLDAFKEMYCSPDIFSARRVAIRLWKESGSTYLVLDIHKVLCVANGMNVGIRNRVFGFVSGRPLGAASRGQNELV